ncbi:MAG: hypothetical protein ACI31C_05245, partial [Muribaculaceae bacterium]
YNLLQYPPNFWRIFNKLLNFDHSLVVPARKRVQRYDEYFNCANNFNKKYALQHIFLKKLGKRNEETAFATLPGLDLAWGHVPQGGLCPPWG